MVVGKSPDWLPPGFIEKVRHKNGRKIKYYVNVAKGVKYYSKQEVIRSTEDCDVTVTPQKENGDENGLSIGNKVEDYGVIVTPQKENGDENGLSIDNKVDVIPIKENDSPAWLPNGWKVEERTRYSGSSKGSVYKVYSEQSSGRKFYSKAAVARYLNTLDHDNTTTVQNKIENVAKSNVHELSTNEPSVDEPSTVKSLQLVPMTNTGDISNVDDKPNEDEPSTVMSPQLVSMKNTGDISNVDNKPNEDEPSTVMSPQLVSMTNTGGINKMKRKNSSCTAVVTERSTDDDLPPGWIKEIKISKSGSKMRRDPFYTDPVSGYVFRSKKDAMRYLETNDISQCASKPFKRELDDIKLIENKISSSNPANEKLPEHKQLGGELTGGEEPSGKAEPETNIWKQKQVHFESDNVEVEGKILSENSEKNAKVINTPGPESGNRPHKNKTKSKKRKGGLSLPPRTSKRLSGSQPEISPIVNLSEHSLRAAARSSVKIPNLALEEDASTSVPQPPPSDIEQSKAVPEEEIFKGDETHQDRLPEEETFKGDETHQDHLLVAVPEEETFKCNETHQDRLREIVENLFNDIEEPPTEGPPEGQSGGEKQIDEETKTTQESQLCYDFGDSWSDPLEFAFKTLMGEISIDDPLTFPSCFSEQNRAPQNQTQNEVAARGESSKQVGPGSSSLGDAGFVGLNRQSSNEVGKKDFQNKFNP